MAMWLVVLGIVERVRVNWMHSGLGLSIWTGVWVGITGAFGVFISFKRVQNLSHGSAIPPHLVMTLMGFSLTCGILSTLFLFTYSQDVAIAGSKSMRWYISSYSGNERSGRVERFPISFDARDKEQHALVGSIYGFVVVELILAMWAVGICLVNDQQQFLTEEEQCDVPLMSPASQGQRGNNVA